MQSANPTIAKTITVALIGAVIGYLAVSYFTDETLDQYRLTIVENVAAQEQRMTSIAVTTSRNGADALVESIVRDCPTVERVRFDTLLGELNNRLSQAELSELERLFGRCGSFFAERKAMMVARLQREVELYRTFVEQLAVLSSGNVTNEYEVDEWEQLAANELRISGLFNRLVVLQDSIIQTLLAGESPESETMQELLTEVNEVQETLAVTNMQTNALRTELIKL